MYSCALGTEYFNDTKSFNNFIGDVSWDKASIRDGFKDKKKKKKKRYTDFPPPPFPHNIVYNVPKETSCLQKSKKSKSLYCAGYYIIKFDKGWVRSFCPKLVTPESYDYKGSSNRVYYERGIKKLQTKEAINTIPIQKFIQQVNVADAGNPEKLRCPSQEAKNLMYLREYCNSKHTR